MLAFSTGCMHDETIGIYVAKQWEGHYFTVDEFKKNTDKIELEKKESIWVLSNSSLSQLMKNASRKD